MRCDLKMLNQKYFLFTLNHIFSLLSFKNPKTCLFLSLKQKFCIPDFQCDRLLNPNVNLKHKERAQEVIYKKVGGDGNARSVMGEGRAKDIWRDGKADVPRLQYRLLWNSY